MTAKDTARQTIAALVDRFKQDASRHTYNEQQSREYYILPLFRALGWNTENPVEFSAEEQISRGFVDFGFYLNHVPVFYLETKRVNEKLDKRENMQQSINYSYLKGVTWAVLTDFERLMVFNADWEEKDPLRAVFLNMTSDEYANGKFDDLWLLSREAMSHAPRLIDTQAERYGRKAIKEKVTTRLFNDLTDWRRRLFTEIRTMGTTLWATDSRAVDNAVQKFFDRLIFIRTVEDREVEPPRLISLRRQHEKKPAQVFPALLKLFSELDGIYNSNLFAAHELDTMQIHDPGLVTEIIDGLYRAKGGFIQYDFNAIDADILGAVYEQYLGFKVIDPDAQIDTTKNRKRKQQGIYYTPQYIVRYIVQQTVGKVLSEGANPDDLRILDPACGSGSFLIEAFNILDRHYARQKPNHTAVERSAWRRRILTHNLYGVDLDEQAVEVTRLNLMLRAALERGKLPLLTHIKHGNSLIADDAIAGKELGFDWKTRFPEVFDASGFDVVIGNPPYVRQETLGAEFKIYAEQHYTTYAGTADLYTYFIEKGFSLLKPGGRMGYIVPNKWMRANYGKPLRAFLRDTTETIIDFGDLPVFAEATTYPCIVTLLKFENPHPLTPSLQDKNPHPPAPSPLRREGESTVGKPPYAPTYTDTELWEKLKPLARQMRHEPTHAENHLWQLIRNRQIGNAKFRRQHPIDRFIVDFYCAEAHLVIEVDGDIHQYTPDEDALRQAFIENRGLRVLRFTNEQVLHQTSQVLESIQKAIQTLVLTRFGGGWLRDTFRINGRLQTPPG